MIALYVALAGGLGAVVRFVLDGASRARWAATFPWPTVLINVTGSLLLGLMLGLTLFRGAPTELELIIGTGFCGGYTTFSTASFETVRLLQQRRYGYALVNSLGTTLLAVSAGALGLWLTSI
ncbi:camphor resistance protein CrcB [Antricoccus suffuscus]|uniref:Fluoride-specific ion channel FluC n=1 Tax=Antricoccus suffuscus TaxID=1629062 RepID=A0A2T1A5M4_9ACTN|nr:fluoride efflux transporter CrcB [Antricoccus suffuscus]PRZ43901.1 camphor resistance protein CrcB [Antricoccus suffuscus]